MRHILLNHPIAAGISIALLSAMASAQELTLTVRIRPDAKLETLKAIAEAATAGRLLVQGYDSAADWLQDQYGSSQQTIRALAFTYNSRMGAAKWSDPNGVVVTVPAAPHWQFRAALPAIARSRLRDQALLTMGNNGPKTKEAIEALNPGLKGKWNVPVSDTIVYPYTAPYVSFRLNPGVDSATLLATLKSDPATLSAEIGPRNKLIPSITHLTADPGARCGVATGTTDWPYGRDLNRLLPRAGSPIIVAILDSGVAPNDNRFHFWSHLRSTAGDRGAGSAVFCDSDPVGCNFLTREGFPVDDITKEGLRSHGTHVAGLASGRLLPVEMVSAINNQIQLMILKVADSDGYIDTGLVYEAIQYAAINGASVVNLSLAGPPAAAIHDAMMNTKSILFVIAAGNDNASVSSDLTATPVLGYPARYSVEFPNVISVAAHDSLSQRACFSNYGSGVDIAAPGVDVESTVEGAGATAKLSGTSQAAPVVTFTAALLFSAGYSRTPEAVKNRIMVSGDFTPELKDVVSSELKLNVAKALAFKNDVIELSDHQLVTGTIDAIDPISVPGEARPILWREVAKIVVAYSTTPGKRSQVTAFRNGKLVRFTLDLPWTEVTGKDEGGRSFKYELSKVLDIVPSGAG